MSHKIIDKRECLYNDCYVIFDVTTKKKSKRYCSRECAILGSKKNIKHERICKNCDNVFEVRAPSEPNKYCSRECSKLVNLGRKATDETRQKMSDSRKGQKAWNKGIPTTDEVRKKISEKGKGRQFSEEHKKKIGEANSRRIWTKESREKMSKSVISKQDHPNWKGGITPINSKIRGSLEYKLWRESVFERDDYTCQFCNKRGDYLNADHIKPFAHYPELRFELSNGRTLCVPCHRTTDTYGGKGGIIKD